ncbi:MAG: hypothetical protein IT462_16210 [Planctomycetes bacterium]|nr:hypothetical protein [Planctomycetota bacterium]
MRRRIWSFVPAFVACLVISMSSGCAGAGQLRREPDGSGGFNVYKMEKESRVEVAHVFKDGKIEYADARLAEGARGIEREAGGLSDGRVLRDAVKSCVDGHCPDAGESWWLFFTVVYFFVWLVWTIVDACEGDGDC